MEANVKPGTRCECRDHDCPEARESVPNAHREDHEPLGIAGGTGFQQCTREAVRMVTVDQGRPPGKLSFRVDMDEAEIIDRIVSRALVIAAKAKLAWDYQTATLDITATHASGNPLKLLDLATAHEADFAHDVLGIRRHIDRNTGKLGNCFLPRFSEPEKQAPMCAACAAWHEARQVATNA